MLKELHKTVVTSAIILSTPALAQDRVHAASGQAQAGATVEDTADESTGDIVVTAQRRSERLQDVGIAVSAFAGDSLRSQGVTSSVDLAKFTPGVSITGSAGGQSSQFSIRGVTQSDYNDTVEAPVAVYIDDVYIASQQGQGQPLFDLTRVEVLKGPQGTLFGRNATGGLISFVIEKPRLDAASAYVSATYGRFDQTVLESAINLPLGDDLALRISGIWNRHGSVWKNVAPRGVVNGAPLTFGTSGISPGGEDLGRDDSLAGRAQLLWESADGVSLRFVGSAFRQNLSSSPFASSAVTPIVDQAGRVVGEIYTGATDTRSAIGPDGENFFNPSVLPFQAFMYSPNGDGRRAPGATWFGYVPVDIGKREISEDLALADRNRFRAYSGAIHADVEIGHLNLASISAFSRYNKDFVADADGSPVNVFGFGTRSRLSTLSQEVRLSGETKAVTWQVGAYYLDIVGNNAQEALAPANSALAVAFGLPASGVDPVSVFRLKTESASAFGQATWRFAPRLSVVAGARLTREHQDYRFSSYLAPNTGDYRIDTAGNIAETQPSFRDRRNQLLWAGKLQLEYRPADRVLAYVGVNRGVKGGSYNGKLFDGGAPLAPDAIPYKAEVLTSLESGLKLSGANGSYALNTSVFHYWYDDFQAFQLTDFSGSVRNADARTIGIEVDGSVRLFPGFRVGGSAAYLDATVKDLQIAPGIFRDTRPIYTPKFSSNANVSYTVDAGSGTLTLASVLSHQSSVFSNARNFDGQRFAGRTLLDFSANWELPTGLNLGAFLKNATDRRYKTIGIDFGTTCGCNVEAYGMPRTWGVKIGYRL